MKSAFIIFRIFLGLTLFMAPFSGQSFNCPLTPPAAIYADDSGDGVVALDWPQVSNAHSYKAVLIDLTLNSTISETTTSGLHFDATGLQDQHLYEVEISARACPSGVFGEGNYLIIIDDVFQMVAPDSQYGNTLIINSCNISKRQELSPDLHKASDENPEGRSDSRLNYFIRSKTNSPASAPAFPNPFRDQLNVSFDNPTGSKVMVSIADMSGKNLFFEVIYTEKISIPTAEYAPGVYLLKIESPNVKEIFKVVKSQ